MNELEEIKSKIDIAELVGSYVQLKQTGKNFKACCPFHNEKTPSFIVSPEKQMWHCFGSCAEGGDIFSFLMKMEGLSFPEAVKVLADKAGVKLSRQSYEPSEKKNRLFSANELAADYYAGLLYSPAGKPALDYLKKRKLTEKTIKDFGLGYSPTEKNALMGELKKHGLTIEEIEKSGLATKKQGEMRDFFWGRLMFPIRDITGRVVGFSARVLDDSLPKYINTGETEIYSKSNILFGIDLAKESIRKLDYAIIVEGQMDVIGSHQGGVLNVVAPGGTALTENQLKTLGRLTKNLKLAFDIDFAGSQATRRAIELAWNLGFNIKVIEIPTGKDPADAVAEDPKIWKDAVKKSVYVVDYLFDQALKKYDKGETLGKKSIAKELLPVIKRIPDEIERDTYIKKLAGELGVDETSIVSALAKVAIRVPKEEVLAKKDTAPKLEQKQTELEKNLIGLLILLPHYLDFAIGLLSKEDFSDAQVGEDYQSILEYYNKKGELTEQKFIASVTKDTKERFNLYVLSAETTFEEFDDEKRAEEIYFGVKRLKKLSLGAKKRKLSDEVAAFEKEGETAEAKKTLVKLQTVLEEERSIS